MRPTYTADVHKMAWKSAGSFMTMGNHAESAGLAGCWGSMMCIIDDESGSFANLELT